MGPVLDQLLLQFPPPSWGHSVFCRSPPAAALFAARLRRSGRDGWILAREHALPVVHPDAASTETVGLARRARRLRHRDDDGLWHGARCLEKAMKTMKTKIT